MGRDRIRDLRDTADLKYGEYQKGQLSIFFGMSLLVIVTCIAFVVNVGLFVKAKINLQNAIDAAAFAGAAVQARQLSTIAYLNWEMRNTFKEWMFKYYVLGTLSLGSKTQSPTGGTMDFTMKTDVLNTDNVDQFNIPSVCIEFQGADVPMCQIFVTPGLPRFGKLGYSTIDDTMSSIGNVLIEKKGHNCSKRSDINYSTAIHWTYGVPSKSTAGEEAKELFKRASNIAIDRTGAWIKAIELAFRIRNLEKIMNLTPGEATTPVTICMSGQNCVSINNLFQRDATVPLYERTVKAFLSGYRNLENNGDIPGYKSGTNHSDLKASFRMTEIIPNAFDASSGGLPTLSTLPIDYSKVKSKYYVDLHLHSINFAIMYTIFSSTTGVLKLQNTGDLQSDASCAATKAAIPVPGYPFGFVKNPDILTYYALKGEAEYTGLFNPFSGNGITLTAYAAAKPFGGRIGPMIFMSGKFQNDGSNRSVFARKDIRRSYSYLGYLLDTRTNDDVRCSNPKKYIPGCPLPQPGDQSGVSNFWITNQNANTHAVGGVPQGSQVVYGVPNMIYAFLNHLSMQIPGTDKSLFEVADGNKQTRAGLYDTVQFRAFRSHYSGNSINAAIASARAPTGYEAMNYLIPTFHSRTDSSPHPPDTPDFVVDIGRDNATGEVFFPIFAPLWGADERIAYYKQMEMGDAIAKYIFEAKASIQIYVDAIKEIANAIRASASAKGASVPGGPSTDDAGLSKDNYAAAANELYPCGVGSTSCDVKSVCSSIGGKFEYFFLGGVREPAADTKCPGIPSLGSLIQKHWNDQLQNTANSPAGTDFTNYYTMAYHPPLATLPGGVDWENMDGTTGVSERLMTAYLPGGIYGADEKTGMFPHPYDFSLETNAKRNYYSTKLIPIKSLLKNGGASENIAPYIKENDLTTTSYSEKSYDPADIRPTFQNYMPDLGFRQQGRPILE
ncbi:MAG: hypothetical protein HQK53_01915 [Oligoflexia bacterium]|nr:hypothetical protein [Oligoflexia bacterium]